MVDLKCNNSYLINTKGEVFSKKTGKQLKPHLHEKGYLRVTLQCDGKKKKHRIHRLVAEQFINNPDNLPQVNHKDGNKLNNDISNLEWCTQSQNMQHAVENGLHNNGGNKLDKEQIVDIYNNLSSREAVDKYGISRFTYYDIKKLRYAYYRKCLGR